jgi:hypothetical protein
MSSYNYTVSVNPPTPQVAQTLVKAIVNDLKVEAQWDKNAGRIGFAFDAEAFNTLPEADGDPTLVANVKRAEATLKAAIAEAEKAGLAVVWVHINPANGSRQMLAEPSVIITRTY